jgi:hypothetical protein
MPDTSITEFAQSLEGLGHSIDAACQEITRLRLQQQALLEALRVARRYLRYWHGVGLSAEEEALGWHLYQDSAEMQLINTAIVRAEGT